ncbi:DeoR/GlpR family DNA-binding transcription regulator [uncultured Tessaracoccus sp.]|uniref:DeoR/GlpR family DNA-binding transcription regulator n=1 Tax=uncultured Tessaracoccus sp. TaxID=905023 RepID=UPI0025E83438|nr:DeoR/GlpR family DNA-binding transcription regulator [uncultured Tessaracoccus sp.]
MLSEDRQLRITTMVRDRGFVTVSQLCDMFGVSEATVRRDLDSLADAGQIRRVRGGAGNVRGTVRPEPDLRNFADVALTASEAKRSIARKAAALVEDGDVIAMDAGTTVAAMCPFLMQRSLTVVTASLAVVDALSSVQDIDLVVVGGILRPNYRSMVGILAEQMLAQIKVDKVFLGTSGIADDGSVMDTTPSEVPIKQALLRSARHRYVLADAEKFEGGGFLKVCGLDRVDALITDGDVELPDDVEVEVIKA